MRIEYAGITLDGSADALRALTQRIRTRTGALARISERPPPLPPVEIADDEGDPGPMALSADEERPEK